MTLNFEECVKFANRQFICSIATVDGDQPRVRNVGLWVADKNGFYFSTHKAKAFYCQLLANPKVELSFYARPKLLVGRIDVGTKARIAHLIRRFYSPSGFTTDLGTMMRVTGTVEFIGDIATRERLFNDRPFLRSIAENIAIFCVPHGEAWFWTAKDNARESEIEHIHF
ncbi:MAG: pyridoxamine 5'-phosphate oxidase family protein [Halobacteriota archaeon]